MNFLPSVQIVSLYQVIGGVHLIGTFPSREKARRRLLDEWVISKFQEEKSFKTTTYKFLGKYFVRMILILTKFLIKYIVVYFGLQNGKKETNKCTDRYLKKISESLVQFLIAAVCDLLKKICTISCHCQRFHWFELRSQFVPSFLFSRILVEYAYTFYTKVTKILNVNTL